MESLMMVYMNSTTEDRYEELNFWYNVCHIGDVLSNGAIYAVQRFELSNYQPKNADTSRKALTLWEVMDLEYCQKWHVKTAQTWRMRLSTAIADDYVITPWLPMWGTADWAEYADYKGDKAVFTVKLKAREGRMDPKDYFTVEKLKEIRNLHGFHALHLFDRDPERQNNPEFPSPAEYADYTMVAQISNCYMVANEWDKYLEAHPEIEENFEIFASIYEPMIPRIRDAEIFSKPEWRALHAIGQLLMTDPEGRIAPIVPMDEKEASHTPEFKDFVDIEYRYPWKDDNTKGPR